VLQAHQFRHHLAFQVGRIQQGYGLGIGLGGHGQNQSVFGGIPGGGRVPIRRGMGIIRGVGGEVIPGRQGDAVHHPQVLAGASPPAGLGPVQAPHPLAGAGIQDPALVMETPAGFPLALRVHLEGDRAGAAEGLGELFPVAAGPQGDHFAPPGQRRREGGHGAGVGRRIVDLQPELLGLLGPGLPKPRRGDAQETLPEGRTFPGLLPAVDVALPAGEEAALGVGVVGEMDFVGACGQVQVLVGDAVAAGLLHGARLHLPDHLAGGGIQDPAVGVEGSGIPLVFQGAAASVDMDPGGAGQVETLAPNLGFREVLQGSQHGFGRLGGQGRGQQGQGNEEAGQLQHGGSGRNDPSLGRPAGRLPDGSANGLGGPANRGPFRVWASGRNWRWRQEGSSSARSP